MNFRLEILRSEIFPPSSNKFTSNFLENIDSFGYQFVAVTDETKQLRNQDLKTFLYFNYLIYFKEELLIFSCLLIEMFSLRSISSVSEHTSQTE